jgi:hypothetical protein
MDVSALDENGKPIDWWFIYKVPQLTQDAASDSATGYEYVYFDANSARAVKSPNLLNQNNGALNVTLNSVFRNPGASTGWILYNDEMPAAAKGKDSERFGHTKGVIAFDSGTKSAFWLLHSWPKFAAGVRPDLSVRVPLVGYRPSNRGPNGEPSGAAVLSPSRRRPERHRPAHGADQATESESSRECGRP